MRNVFLLYFHILNFISNTVCQNLSFTIPPGKNVTIIVNLNRPNLVPINNGDLIVQLSNLTTTTTASVGSSTSTVSWSLGQEYWLRTVFLIPNWVDVKTVQFQQDIQERLSKVIALAVERQQAKRYKLPENQNDVVEDTVQVKVLNISREGATNRVTVVYVAAFNGYYIGANALSEDLKLIGDSEFSAYMGYPVQQSQSYVAPEQTEKQNLWIIGVVIGSTIGVLLCGWCLLFVYYNTCGRIFTAETIDKSKIDANQNQSSNAAAKIVDENDRTREQQKIYLISTDVQTESNDEEEMKATQPISWIVPRHPITAQKPDTLQLSTSFDSSQNIQPVVQQQKSQSNLQNSSKVFKRGSSVNGTAITSPPPKSESGGSVTLKTNDDSHTLGISFDMPDARSNEQGVDRFSYGGASGFISGVSPGSSYGVNASRTVASNYIEEVWSLYPFQRHQAGDAMSKLSEVLVSEHPRPGPWSNAGGISMHSNQFKPRRLEPMELSQVFGLI